MKHMYKHWNKTIEVWVPTLKTTHMLDQYLYRYFSHISTELFSVIFWWINVFYTLTGISSLAEKLSSLWRARPGIDGNHWLGRMEEDTRVRSHARHMITQLRGRWTQEGKTGRMWDPDLEGSDLLNQRGLPAESWKRWNTEQPLRPHPEL